MNKQVEQVRAEGRCSIKPNDDYCDDFFIITQRDIEECKTQNI